MLASLIEVLEAGLSIWESKEKNKYVENLMKLKRQYYAEINKPFPDRNNATLDNIEFQLRLLSKGFSSRIGIPPA